MNQLARLPLQAYRTHHHRLPTKKLWRETKSRNRGSRSQCCSGEMPRCVSDHRTFIMSTNAIRSRLPFVLAAHRDCTAVLRSFLPSTLRQIVNLPFVLWTQGQSSIVFARWRQCALLWGDIGATWRIQLNRWRYGLMSNYTVSQKYVPPLTCYNLDVHDQTAIFSAEVWLIK